MRKNTVNRGLAAAMAAFAMMLAVAPVTAKAAGTGFQTQTYQQNGKFSYIVLTNSSQDAILKRLQALNVNQDCQWVQDVLSQICPEVPEQPIKPIQPETPEQPTEPVQPETPEQPSQGQSTFAARVMELVNEERAKAGLSSLAYDANMEKAALVRAQEIQSSFSHTRPNGSSFSTAMKEAGVTYQRAGENIAWGQKSPEEVVEGWMNSPSHRANIMNANYGRIGVGHLKNAQGTSYWVQLFAN